MSPEALPEEVQRLLRAHVPTYEHLAVLLLLYRERGRMWSIQELGQALRIASKLMDCALADLIRAGLVQIASHEPEPQYRYGAAQSVDAAVALLAREYSDNPVGVVKFLSAGAIQRLRTSALRAFSDAFVITKRERDDG